ncbi:sporulation integral membrane protein YlbJ [Caldalkalibacillus salinus]|uniref:sporulation integral membrane protein YlbJ n=1 Tax=Caldalkalibacillus salinus TaxID=2803787 RepID=UPI0019240B24|nr:sporulation integral membrane protein YlbJ [Caldalkalibacillus salinus]
MKHTAYIKTATLALFSLLLVILIIAFPKQAYESSLRGLTIWWDVVFPALLPFFITAELLIGFGVVHFIGTLLEPLMRPLFRVPGVGGFVMSMGLASGHPMGAKLTVQLREQGLVSRIEGERLVSFTGTSGPLFMFGAVSVGFFQDVTLGIIIALCHYIATLLVALLMRYHGYRDQPSEERRPRMKRSVLYRALQDMHRARMKDGRTFGALIGDAVTSSIQTLLLIGGFIIIFSVIINILNIVGISALLAMLYKMILIPFGLHSSLSLPLVAGTFEITLGSQWASELKDIALVHKVAMTSAIIAWSGLSVHAQVTSFIAKTDIRYKPYVIARFFHAIFAALLTYLLWQPFQAFIQRVDIPAFTYTTERYMQAWHFYTYFIYASIFVFCMLTILMLLQQLAKKQR